MIYIKYINVYYKKIKVYSNVTCSWFEISRFKGSVERFYFLAQNCLFLMENLAKV